MENLILKGHVRKYCSKEKDFVQIEETREQ